MYTIKVTTTPHCAYLLLTAHYAMTLAEQSSRYNSYKLVVTNKVVES